MATPAPDATALQIRADALKTVGAGAIFWHQHHLQYAATAFYGGEYRFAGHLAQTARTMFWMADTPSAALWESLLREVFGNPQGEGLVHRTWIEGRRLSALRTVRALRLVDLTPGPLRATAGNQDNWDAWQNLTQTPYHEDTHGPTAATLDAIAAQLGIDGVDGFLWHSRQAGTPGQRPTVIVLFAPPAGAADLLVDDGGGMDLNTPGGWDVIQSALKEAHLILRRVDPADDRAIADAPLPKDLVK